MIKLQVKKHKIIFSLIIILGVFSLFNVFGMHKASATSLPDFVGYFYGNTATSGNNVLPAPIPSSAQTSIQAFISWVESEYNSPPTPQDKTAAAFYILTMMGYNPGTSKGMVLQAPSSFPNGTTNTNGETVMTAWANLVTAYAADGAVNLTWTTPTVSSSTFTCQNTFYQTSYNDIAYFNDLTNCNKEVLGQPAIAFFNPTNKSQPIYVIRVLCGNPNGIIDPLPNPPPTTIPISGYVKGPTTSSPTTPVAWPGAQIYAVDCATGAPLLPAATTDANGEYHFSLTEGTNYCIGVQSLLPADWFYPGPNLNSSIPNNGSEYTLKPFNGTPTSGYNFTYTSSTNPIPQPGQVKIQGLVSETNGSGPMYGVTVVLTNCGTNIIQKTTTTTSTTYNYSFNLTTGNNYCIGIQTPLPSQYSNDSGPQLNTTGLPVCGVQYCLKPFTGTTPTTGYHFYYLAPSSTTNTPSITITGTQCPSSGVGTINYKVYVPQNYVTIKIAPNGTPNPQYKPSQYATGPGGYYTGTYSVSNPTSTTFALTVQYQNIQASVSTTFACPPLSPPGGSINGACGSSITGTFNTSSPQVPSPSDTITFTATYNSSGASGQTSEGATVTPTGGRTDVLTGTDQFSQTTPYNGGSYVQTSTYTYVITKYNGSTTSTVNGQTVTTYSYTSYDYQEEFTQWSFTAPNPSSPIVQFSISSVSMRDSYGNTGSFSACDPNAPALYGLQPSCQATNVSYTEYDTDYSPGDPYVTYSVDGGASNPAGQQSADMSKYDQLVAHNVEVAVQDVNYAGAPAPSGYGWPNQTASTVYGPCWAPNCSASNVQVSGVIEFGQPAAVTVNVGFVPIGNDNMGDASRSGLGSPTIWNSPETSPTLSVGLDPPNDPPVIFTNQQAAGGNPANFTNLPSESYTVTWTFNSPAMADQGLTPTPIGTTISASCSAPTFVVAYKPYLRVYGGDISGGNGIDLTNTGTCTPNTPSSSVIAYNDPNLGYSGAGSQYAAYAITHITDFATGDGSSGGPSLGSPTDLSFANTGASPTNDNFGGGYQGNLPCIPNYYTAPVASGTTLFTCPSAITISNGNLPGTCTTSTGISGAKLRSIPSGQRVVVKVDGSVTINSPSGPGYNTSSPWGTLQNGTGTPNTAPLTTSVAAQQFTCSGTNGNNQVYSIASGATSVTVTAIGGQGGGSGPFGSQVSNTINVTPGMKNLTVDVGCPGSSPGGGSGYVSGASGTTTAGYWEPYSSGQMGCFEWTYVPPSPTNPDGGYTWPCLDWQLDQGVIWVPGTTGYGGGGSSAVLNNNSLMLEAKGGAGSGTTGGAGGGANYTGTSASGYSSSVEQTATQSGLVSISSNVPFNAGSAIGSQPPATTQSVSVNVPSLYIIAKGNIYIGHNVSTMTGVYVAEGSSDLGNGIIYTCYDPSHINSPNSQNYYNYCNKQLVVNGSFIAGRVAMGRTYGTADQGTAGDTAANPQNGWNNAAEVFNYTAAQWLNNPFAKTTNTYDAISNLPPVL